MPTTTRPQVVPLAPNEFDEARRLIDLTMRPDADLSMADDFPLLVGRGARARRLVVKERGRIVAHAASRTATVTGPTGRLFELCNIGAVCTDPAARGRGHARTLCEDLCRMGADAGADLAVLWTDIPEFYRKMGFHEAGRETRFLVRADDVAGAPTLGVRQMTDVDLPELQRIRARDTAYLVRSDADARRLFHLPMSETWVAGDGGRIDAYAVIGKGLDCQGIIHEWGGPAGGLPSLLRGILAARGQNVTLVMGPTWDRDFLAAFEEYRCPREDVPLAMFRILRRDGLNGRFPALGRETDDGAWLKRLLGSPSAPPPRVEGLPISFHVWGLDSM